jgi:SAM-dependent methyltransferase
MLEEEYSGIVISLIPSQDQDVLQQLSSASFLSNTRLQIIIVAEGGSGRYLALQKALESTTDFIHYADMDRLLHWVETQPDEWKRMLGEVEKFDCVIFGRTPRAYLTHPQALIQTEKLSNQVVSHILKQDMDVSAGSKSFSRIAARCIIDNCSKDNSIGTDAEWPICIKKASFYLKYIPVEGLEWESADQFMPRAASADEQSLASKNYDSDPKHWADRAEIANGIIHTALEVSQKEISIPEDDQTNTFIFDNAAVFEVDDYLYFYSETLTNERSQKEVDALVRILALDEPKKILDLACGFGRHTNRLAQLGHIMTGVDISPGFLEIARQDALSKGVNVAYRQIDMRKINFTNEFDCVLLLFTAFGYFTDEENLKVLLNIRNALVPGGWLIVDIPNRDTFLRGMQPFYVTEKEGNMMIDRLSFDNLQGRSYNRRVVFRDGVRKDKPFSLRLYNSNEIHALIKQAGLTVEHIYGDWDSQELNPESRRLVVIARKQAL